jgi:hypothetical protein
MNSDFSVRSESHFGQLLKLTKYTQLNKQQDRYCTCNSNSNNAASSRNHVCGGEAINTVLDILSV